MHMDKVRAAYTESICQHFLSFNFLRPWIESFVKKKRKKKKTIFIHINKVSNLHKAQNSEKSTSIVVESQN